MKRSVRKAESAWLRSGSREDRNEKRKMYLEKRRFYAKAVRRAKREYEQSMRTKLEEKAGSGDFWKCVRAAGLTNKSRRRVNLEEVYDQQGEIKTKKDAVEVWRSYFEALLGGQTEQDEADTCSEFEAVQPTICGGDGAQSDLCSLLDMPILQDEVDCAFSRVKKEAAPGKDGISFRMMSTTALRDLWLALFGACWRTGMIPSEWRRSLVVPVPKKLGSGVCVPDTFRGIALTSVVCKVFCQILKERLTTMVEEYNMVVEEQGGFRKGRGCRDQIVSLMLLGQTKLATQEGGFLAAFIDFSKAYDRVCRKKLWECLKGYSVSGKFLAMLQALYLDNSVEVKIGDKRSDHFPVSSGLRQGCVLSPLLFSLYINGLVVELKRKRCGVECGGLLIPGLLFADDTSLFGEDVKGLERSLMVLEEWCSRWGMKVNVEKSAIIHFRKKSCLQWDHEFSIGGEVIPMVTKYKYLGCVIDEFFDLNAMVDDRVEAGRRALGYLLRGTQSAVGVLFGCTFKKLYDSMVQSVLLYGAEAWGCLRCLEPLEQVQLRAFRTYFAVPRSHSRTSLLAEMEVLSVGWEAKIRCIGFWHRILTDQRYHQRLIQRLAYAALMTPRRSQWIGKLGICLEAFGWQDCSCATLAGVSGRQLREMLRSIACRYMEKDWTEDLGSKPKLCVLNSVFVSGLNGRCWKVQEKSHRRMLMMLRGGSAPLQIETGRWKGVPREERLCRECGMNEVEDCDHWLLRCSRWDIERQHLLANVQQRLPNFASIIDDMQRSAVITDLACKDRRTAQLIYSMWTARFG